MAAYILKPLANIMATHYFACSPEAGNFLFGKHKKVFIAHNGVDTDVFLRTLLFVFRCVKS